MTKGPRPGLKPGAMQRGASVHGTLALPTELNGAPGIYILKSNNTSHTFI